MNVSLSCMTCVIKLHSSSCISSMCCHTCKAGYVASTFVALYKSSFCLCSEIDIVVLLHSGLVCIPKFRTALQPYGYCLHYLCICSLVRPTFYLGSLFPVNRHLSSVHSDLKTSSGLLYCISLSTSPNYFLPYYY